MLVLEVLRGKLVLKLLSDDPEAVSAFRKSVSYLCWWLIVAEV